MRLRLIVGAIVLVAALLLLPRFLSDFAQDYAAARAWWRGLSPNSRTAAILGECCAEIAPLYGGMHTAHPPLATLLALPLGWLPWPAARLIWLALAWAALVGAWQIGQVSPWACAATGAFWVIALGLGTHEPLLFLLLALALRLDRPAPGAEADQPQIARGRWPVRRDDTLVGVLLGLCAALKVYPIVLIGGLLLARRYAAAAMALASGAALALLSELVLGFGVTAGWLRFVPINTSFYVDQIGNGSLVRLVRAVLPGAPIAPVTLAALGLLMLPLIPRLRRGDWLRPLVPVMLLASPLSWRHYMGLAAISRLGRAEQAALALAGVAALLIGLQLLPPDNMAPIVQGPLLIVLIWLWYRDSVRKPPAEPKPPSLVEVAGD